MQSKMSKLAQTLWSDLRSLLLPSAKTEAAQRVVDMFEEAGCTDIHECVQLVDAARESVLDDDELPLIGASATVNIYDQFDGVDGFEDSEEEVT